MPADTSQFAYADFNDPRGSTHFILLLPLLSTLSVCLKCLSVGPELVYLYMPSLLFQQISIPEKCITPVQVCMYRALDGTNHLRV
jgi:hypothetical protein